MGYNGGTNKRGYYRRNHGMYSKSSYKFGEKILSNTILGGLGLIAAAGSALADASDSLPTDIDRKPKHFDAKKQNRQFIGWGIIALLCPIAGFLTFEYADFWMFFSVLIFGFIETVIVVAISTPANNAWHEKDYIYEDEVDSTAKNCKKNRRILIGLYIALFILNLYPIGLFIIDCLDVFKKVYFPIYGWDGGETSLPIILVCIKLFINGAFIVEILQKKIVVENYTIIRKRTDDTENKAKIIMTDESMPTITESSNNQVNKQPPTQVSSEESIKSLSLIEDIKLPKISGSYKEYFWYPYGTLYIYANSATISFCFPGPDQRYKSTYFDISEKDIDKYILAYNRNWQIAETLLEQAKNLPNTELKQKGEMDMDIVVRNEYVSIYLYYYHLPLHTKKECDEMILSLEKAKRRIKQVQERLFAE